MSVSLLSSVFHETLFTNQIHFDFTWVIELGLDIVSDIAAKLHGRPDIDLVRSNKDTDFSSCLNRVGFLIRIAAGCDIFKFGQALDIQLMRVSARAWPSA